MVQEVESLIMQYQQQTHARPQGVQVQRESSGTRTPWVGFEWLHSMKTVWELKSSQAAFN